MEKRSKSLPKCNTPTRSQAIEAIIDLGETLSQEPMYDVTDASVIENLDYLLAIPFDSFGGCELYDSLEKKAAALFYFTIKDHLFANGNKRTALILTTLLLSLNGYWLDLSTEEAYDFALRVAKSSQMDSKAEYAKTLRFFSEHIIKGSGHFWRDF